MCACFWEGKSLNGKENEKCATASYFLLRGGKRNVRPKFLEHSFVREFAFVVCLSLSDFWVCFGGVVVGFKQQNGATTFDLGNGLVS